MAGFATAASELKADTLSTKLYIKVNNPDHIIYREVCCNNWLGFFLPSQTAKIASEKCSVTFFFLRQLWMFCINSVTTGVLHTQKDLGFHISSTERDEQRKL